MNARAGAAYQGLDRFAARKKVVEDMDSLGLVDKIEDMSIASATPNAATSPARPWSANSVRRHEELAKPAIQAVKDGTIKFHPER
jgi:valyl-tRNA synthetase